jgi:hypothetical protein
MDLRLKKILPAFRIAAIAAFIPVAASGDSANASGAAALARTGHEFTLPASDDYEAQIRQMIEHPQMIASRVREFGEDQHTSEAVTVAASKLANSFLRQGDILSPVRICQALEPKILDCFLDVVSGVLKAKIATLDPAERRAYAQDTEKTIREMVQGGHLEEAVTMRHLAVESGLITGWRIDSRLSYMEKSPEFEQALDDLLYYREHENFTRTYRIAHPERLLFDKDNTPYVFNFLIRTIGTDYAMHTEFMYGASPSELLGQATAGLLNGRSRHNKLAGMEMLRTAREQADNDRKAGRSGTVAIMIMTGMPDRLSPAVRQDEKIFNLVEPYIGLPPEKGARPPAPKKNGYRPSPTFMYAGAEP